MRGSRGKVDGWTPQGETGAALSETNTQEDVLRRDPIRKRLGLAKKRVKNG
jgi:hypothetical protein